jgi:hypothetical protein
MEAYTTQLRVAVIRCAHEHGAFDKWFDMHGALEHEPSVKTFVSQNICAAALMPERGSLMHARPYGRKTWFYVSSPRKAEDDLSGLRSNTRSTKKHVTEPKAPDITDKDCGYLSQEIQDNMFAQVKGAISTATAQLKRFLVITAHHRTVIEHLKLVAEEVRTSELNPQEYNPRVELIHARDSLAFAQPLLQVSADGNRAKVRFDPTTLQFRVESFHAQEFVETTLHSTPESCAQFVLGDLNGGDPCRNFL